MASQTVAPKAKKDRQDSNMERRKKHDHTVKKATSENKAAGRRGQVWVARLPGMEDDSKTWPHRAGSKNINVGSGSRGDFKQLMPPKLGTLPLRFKGDKTSADVKNVENVWQFCKVFAKDIGLDGKPTPEWFATRLKGWADPNGHQWGKKKQPKGTKPVYFLWGHDEKLQYLEARSRIFCRVYATLAVRTLAYRRLVELIEKGTNIQILGLDGYDYVAEKRSLHECLNDPNRNFGHEFILAGLLTGDCPWRKNYSPGAARDGRHVPASAQLLDPIPPPVQKRKTTNAATTASKQTPLQNGGSSSSTTTKRKASSIQERNVQAAIDVASKMKKVTAAAATATTIVEANGKVSLPPPRPRKRARRNGYQEIPVFIVMDADKAGQIPDSTKFFLNLKDATDELHEDKNSRVMMISQCGDHNNKD